MKTKGLGPAVLALILVGACPAPADDAMATCPVSKKAVRVDAKTPRVLVNSKPVYFCCEECPKAFRKQPEKFVSDAGACVVLGTPAVVSAELRLAINNGLYYFCCPGCPSELAAAPDRLPAKLADPVNGKEFKATAQSPHVEYQGQHYYFVSGETKSAFLKAPEKYAVLFGK